MMGRSAGEKAVFWTWHGYSSWEHTAAVVSRTRPTQDQASHDPSTDGVDDVQVPTPSEVLLAVDNY